MSALVKHCIERFKVKLSTAVYITEAKLVRTEKTLQRNQNEIYLQTTRTVLLHMKTYNLCLCGITAGNEINILCIQDYYYYYFFTHQHPNCHLNNTFYSFVPRLCTIYQQKWR